MGKRVRITRLPQAASGLDVKLQGLKAGLGFNANTMPWPVMAGKFSKPDVEVNSTLKPVPRDEANLEAEKGETALLPGAGGVPDTFKISGKRHSEGGTPLNLPGDSFIYSDTKDMRIKDPTILKQFMMSKTSTPADISKKYDIGKFKKVLLDPDSDDIQKQTAEAMIKNYNLKLAKLALYQESMKGFPQGLPVVAMPYIVENNIDTSHLMTGEGQPDQDGDNSVAQFGGVMKGDYINRFPDEFFQTGGSIPGFGSEENAADFAKNYPGIYNMYRQALASGDAQKMKEAAKYIKSQQRPQTPWYSLDIVPWSDADKFSDIAGILEEHAKSVPYQRMREDIEKRSMEAPTKVKTLYDTMLKEYNSIPNEDYVTKANKSAQMKQFEQFLPEKRGSWQKWYTKDELDQIDRMLKSQPKIAEAKPSTSSTSDEAPVISGEKLQNLYSEKKPEVKPVYTKPKETSKSTPKVDMFADSVNVEQGDW